MADFAKLKRRTLGAPPPPTEASTNLEQPELAPAPAASQAPHATAPENDLASYRRRDGRSMRRSNRVVQFATRVTPEFDERIRAIAERDGLLIVEVLERALDAYDGKELASNKKAAR
jgi:hypothetical protein